MKKQFLRNLASPTFKAKGYYIVLQPLRLLSWRQKSKLHKWATKHWSKAPVLMHRVYWLTN